MNGGPPGAPTKSTRLLLPLGLLVQPGVRLAVDQGHTSTGRFGICFPNGCFAEVHTSNGFVEELKRGTHLNVSVQNQAGREVRFAVPVAGFAESFEGPAIDPQVLQEQQRKVAEELKRRSEEVRKAATHASPDPAELTTPNAAKPDVAPSAGPASAAPTASATSEAPPAPSQVTVSSIAEKDLMSASGNTLGDIERIVENTNDKKKYAVVSRGGLLGLFNKEYAVPVERLAIKNDDVVVPDITEEQLTRMPFKDTDNSYRTLEADETINVPAHK